jgi:DNA-directed RNA polymerase sigma subunit (sigma70/sigma32)
MKTGWGVTRREIDLGLALLSVANRDREEMTYEDIAAWCGCHRSRIEQIEKGALRKLRGALHGKRRKWL